MADRVSAKTRSKIMKSVGAKNTKPELAVRRYIHKLGFRFRLHRRDLPGTPDIVFPGRKKVIFVHGCFWHGHGCAYGKLPRSRIGYWSEKIKRNQERDSQVLSKLHELGWEVLVVWQCETKDWEQLGPKLVAFLSG